MARLNPSIPWFKLSPLPGSVAVNVETPSGTVDGSNVTFTVLNDPKFIVIDGMIRFSGFGYTYSGGTITVDSLIPPTMFIRSIY